MEFAAGSRGAAYFPRLRAPPGGGGGGEPPRVGVARKVGPARLRGRRAPRGAEAWPVRVQQAARAARAPLRAGARGLYPPLLADQGLSAALSAQARRAAIPVTVEPGR